MTTTKKSTRQAAKKSATPPVLQEATRIDSAPKANWAKRLGAPFKRTWQWRKSLQPRTPHKSFRWTRRRDYERSLELPGYIAFTAYVWRTLWHHRDTFVWMVLAYALMSGLLVGFASQSTYSQLGELLRSTGGDIFQGNIGQLSQAGVLLAAAMSGGINPDLTDTQQFMSGLLVLLAWLTTVWLLRAYLAGSKPKLRDGLYNAGAPIVPTVIISLILVLQLIPVAIAAIGVSAAMPTGLVSEGIEAMLFWAVVVMLILLSLYWMVSTLFALVVVTLPGVYPLNALRSANELVVGRRLRIVLRVLWLLFVTALFWVAVMLPVILFDAWLKGILPAIQWLPMVPVSLLVVTAASVVWIASYTYLLYRKVVDNDAAPA